MTDRSPKSEAAGGAGGLKLQPDPGQGPFSVKMGKPSGGDGGQLVQGHLPAIVELTSVCRPWPE